MCTNARARGTFLEETYASTQYHETIILHNPFHQFLPPLGTPSVLSP